MRHRGSLRWKLHPTLVTVLVVAITLWVYISCFMFIQHSFDQPSQCMPTSAQVPACEVVHIAVMCIGHQAVLNMTTLVKSILFYRRNPIHLHLMSSIKEHNTISTLFRTWDLAMVELSLYDTDRFISTIKWIPNRHYSKSAGLLKLLIPDIISVSKVISLDTDVIVLTDIAMLWQEFTSFEPSQFIGLVENMTPWYLGDLVRKASIWPSLGTGFNTGVMLLHLDLMRASKWRHIWRLTAEKYLQVTMYASLADQDIINAAIKDKPEIIHRLDCLWNVQINSNIPRSVCWNNPSTKPKILHWNSPSKSELVDLPATQYFGETYRLFIEMDGDVFRNQPLPCPTTRPSMLQLPYLEVAGAEDLECLRFRARSLVPPRTHPNILGDVLTIPEVAVTLITQLTMNRIHMLEDLAKLWEGPISASVYLRDADVADFLYFVHHSRTLQGRTDISYHLSYGRQENFPINYLRNLALNMSKTDMVFLLDVDFLPSQGLHKHLMQTARRALHSKKALVVPAFETDLIRFRPTYTKSELLDLLQNGTVQIFRLETWPQGHAPTNYTHWGKTERMYQVVYADLYEPYVVLRKPFPLYDQRFMGYGWNKVSHIAELNFSGYTFHVDPAGYIVHLNHHHSPARLMFDASRYRQCVGDLKREFERELATKYHV